MRTRPVHSSNASNLSNLSKVVPPAILLTATRSEKTLRRNKKIMTMKFLMRTHTARANSII